MIGEAARLNVRRLAALDTHSARGSRRRRRVIVAEFALGTIGGVALGVWALTWGGVGGVVLGIWLLGWPPTTCGLPRTCLLCGALEAEHAGADLAAELRHYTRPQVLLVPFWVAGLALAQARRTG